MQPAKLSYKIYQGSTFQEAYRWETQTKVYVPIQSITKAAPCVITTTAAHNLPLGWRFRVTGAGGMKEINSVGDDAYYLNTGNASIRDYLESVWADLEEMWLDARSQDIAVAAPATRPWANLPSHLAYIAISNYITPQGTLPPASNLITIAKSAMDARAAWLSDTSSTTTIQANAINSLGYTTYTSGGVIEYNAPMDLSPYKARMQVRKTVSSTELIYEASSDAGQIVLNNTDRTVTITIPASVTAGFNFTSAVYSLELYTTGGTVIPFLAGNLTLVQEITR